MEKMTAYCGLQCDECPAFIATQENDDVKRTEVAQQWSQMFNAEIKPSDINCNGCLTTDGLLFGHCQVCEIRKCGMEKQVENCALCSDYSCDKLVNTFNVFPHAKSNLDEIRKQRLAN